MARLPIPGGDRGNWGKLLNDFLRQSHHDNGSISKVDGNFAKLQLRRATASQWTQSNPTLAIGEIGIEVDSLKRKVGDGFSDWESLPYELTQAFADESYATSTQGALAETAVQPDGDGAVPTDGTQGQVLTMGENGREWLHPPESIIAATPETHGAIGDGTTDDSVALQEALNAGAGGLVWLTGTYGFSRTLSIPAGTRVEGGGTLQMLDGYSLTPVSFRGMGDPMYPYLMVAENGVVVRDLAIKGTTTDTRVQRHVGLLFIDCEGGLAENVNISYINWDTALAGSSEESLGYTLGTVRASNIGIRGGRHEYGGYQNIGIADGSRNILVDGVYCGTGWRTSLQIHRDVWDVDVVNSVVENIQPTAHSAVTIHPISAAPSGRVRINNTRITASTDPAVNQVGGLQLVGTIDGISLTDVDIESNRWGIYLLARGAHLANVRVVSDFLGLDFNGSNLVIEGGSYVVTSGQYAIEVRTSSANTRLNKVLMDATAGTTAFRGGGDGLIINGCTIRGNIMGVQAYGVASKNIVITDNIVESLTHASIHNNTIDSGSGAALIIRGNVITAPLTGNGRGINIESTVVGAIVQGNAVVKGSVGVRVRDSASKAIVKDNNLIGANSGLDVSAPDSIVDDNLVAA